MMKRTQIMRKVIALFLGGLVCLPTMARAEKERKSPLTDAPVIRKRLELRDKRFEFGVGAGVSIGQDFTNALLVMPKLAYHFNDWLALAAVGGFNIYPGWKSTFNSDIQARLPAPDQETNYKSPHPDEALWEMNRIGYVLLGQVEFIPLSGKIALLSSLFSYFDFYVLGGAGVVNLTTTNAPKPACSTTNTCQGQPFTATEFAGNVGVGVHAFVHQGVAINLELRDLIYKNNASGRNVNGDKDPTTGNNIVNNSDLEWTNNWIFGLNVQFFLPWKAKISR
jgi:outer membrane beta-barrel protein